MQYNNKGWHAIIIMIKVDMQYNNKGWHAIKWS